MFQSMWLNLASKSISNTADFFKALGAKVTYPNGETGEMISVSLGHNGQIIYMSDQLFSTMTGLNPKGEEVLISLGVENPELLDDLVARLTSIQASITHQPSWHNGLYVAGFTDLDGHHFNLLVMPNEQNM